MTGLRARIFLLLCGIVLLTGHISTTVSGQQTQNMSVTATVPADANDFQLSLAQTTAGTRFPQQTELDYVITYGSYLEAVTDYTVTASWTQGTVDGESSPTIDVLEYVPGSASNAYGSTPPVIDTVNRTITWTISSFPAQTTNQQVSFSLKTTSTYTGAEFVTFTVSAQASGSSATSLTSAVTKEYQYDASLVPTPTPTVTQTPTPTLVSQGRGPSATPGPQQTATPTPQAQVSPVLPFRIERVNLETVTQTDAAILVDTSQQSRVTLLYGRTISSLSEQVADLSAARSRVISLSGLTQNTRYYFRVIARNAQGTELRSEIYTFITARDGEPIQIDSGRTILTSRHILLYPSAGAIFVLPVQTDYELNLVFQNASAVTDVKIMVPNSHVLGLATTPLPRARQVSAVTLKEVAPGKYTARLVSPAQSGTFDLVARVFDRFGTIRDLTVGRIKVIPHLTVLSKTTGAPIEGARVRLYQRNYRTNKYEVISSQILPVPNPLYSERDGTVRVVLPQGSYRADVSTILDRSQQVYFEIGPGPRQGFPVIYLEREAFSPLSFIHYLGETCLDALSVLRQTLISLSDSLRLFELNAYLLLVLLVCLTYLSLARRIRIPLRSFGSHARYHINRAYRADKAHSLITGIVTDEDKTTPLADADVYLIDPSTDQVLTRTKTRADGRFSFPTFAPHAHALEVIKNGYVATRVHEDSLTLGEEGYRVTVGKHLPGAQIARLAARELFAASLETFLFFTLILEAFFVVVFGLPKTLPFILLTLINLALLISYEVNNRKRGQ